MENKNNNSDITYVPISNIWVARKRENLTQTQLAFLLDHKSTSSLDRWEKGVLPDSQNMMKLAVALSVPVEYLFQDYIALYKSEIVPRKYELGQEDMQM